MICPKCASTNDIGAKFCASCGAPLDNVSSQPKRRSAVKIILALTLACLVCGIVLGVAFKEDEPPIVGRWDVVAIRVAGEDIPLADNQFYVVFNKDGTFEYQMSGSLQASTWYESEELTQTAEQSGYIGAYHFDHWEQDITGVAIISDEALYGGSESLYMMFDDGNGVYFER